MLLVKEGELPEDWRANDGDERMVSMVFPAVVVKGPPMPGLKVEFDYKFPRDVRGARIRATLFRESGKRRSRYKERVYQLEIREGKLTCSHDASHEHIGKLRKGLTKILNFEECIQRFCDQCNLSFQDGAIVPNPVFELKP